MYEVVCLYMGVPICMRRFAYVCGGADLAWMMGLESWWCRAAGRT